MSSALFTTSPLPSLPQISLPLPLPSSLPLQICIKTGNPISQICSSYYTVQSGDTCSDILQQARTGITLSDLYSLNPGLTCESGSNQLLVGEQVSGGV